MAKNWYVVHVYSGFEKKIAQQIKEQAASKGLAEQFDEVPGHDPVAPSRCSLPACSGSPASPDPGGLLPGDQDEGTEGDAGQQVQCGCGYAQAAVADRVAEC